MTAIDRRTALAGLGSAAAGAVLLGRLPDFGSAPADAAGDCLLDPEVTEGPYWIENSLTRRDIREGHAGIPLLLTLTVSRASTCAAVARANVEIWHADAAGVYSGFGTSAASERFLRGHQVADAKGRVTFLTIYPGWYVGRSPHIHLKVHVGGNVVHTGQVFFRDGVSARVYDTSRYDGRSGTFTHNSSDSICAQAGGAARALVRLKRRGHSLTDGFHGYSNLVVQT